MKTQIVKTKAGHHVRLVAKNGKILMSSEVYKTKRAADKLAEKIAVVSKFNIPFSEDNYIFEA